MLNPLRFGVSFLLVQGGYFTVLGGDGILVVVALLALDLGLEFAVFLFNFGPQLTNLFALLVNLFF